MEFDSIRFIHEALEDLNKLDRGIQRMALKKLMQLDKNHSLGKPLGNVGNRNLSEFYKIYFNDNKYRIVYKLVNIEAQIAGIQEVNLKVAVVATEIAKVYGIGKRDKMEIYDDVFKRMLQEPIRTENIN